jgi:hypothetical protein
MRHCCCRSRYNELMEHRQARHIGDIIKERGNSLGGRTPIAAKRRAEDLTGREGGTSTHIVRLQKFLRLLLIVAIWVPLTIGRLVTLPLTSTPHRR